MTSQPSDITILENSESASVVTSISPSEVPLYQDPNDMFAAFHAMYLPRFKLLIEGLGKNRLQKLIYSLVDIPRLDKVNKKFSKNQKEAYLIGDRLLLSKFTMVLSVLYGQAQAEHKASQSEETPVIP